MQAKTAFTLHARRYGDSSLLVELFTEDEGRVTCIAKGALRGKRATVNQPFQRFDVDLRGRGEVLTLARAEALGTPIRLVGKDLYCGLYVNELLLKLTARQDPFPSLFTDYAATLEALATAPVVEPVLRQFELQLLQALGLGLNLDEDIAGAPLVPDKMYTYRFGQGLEQTAVSSGQGCSGQAVIALRECHLDGRTEMREARWLMRRVLDYHLDGRPLRTRELFR
jgi:DNA repair protein RecO (recombination protein O)